MVLAADKLIAKNPAAVKAFVEASAVGWKAYLHGDPRPADALILKDNPEMTEDVLAQARDKMRQYGHRRRRRCGDAGHRRHDRRPLGGLLQDRLRPKGYPPDLDYKSAYTLQFLPNRR